MGQMKEDNIEGIYYLLCVCSLSFFSTLSVIVYYIFNRKTMRAFSFDLIIMLCVSDFFYSTIGLHRSIWMIIDSDAYLNTIGCYIQGVFIQTFTISSFICTTSISYSLYMSVVKRTPIYRQSAFKLFWKNNYLYPFLSGLVICCLQQFDHIKPFPNTLCFISGGNNVVVQLMMLVLYYVPYFFCLIFDSVLTYRIISHHKRIQDDYQYVRLSEILKLACYPFILFICWLPVIVFRILQFFDINSETYVKIGHISDNMIGFFNALFYVFISLDPFRCFVSQSPPDSPHFKSAILRDHTEITIANINKNTGCKRSDQSDYSNTHLILSQNNC